MFSDSDTLADKISKLPLDNTKIVILDNLKIGGGLTIDGIVNNNENYLLVATNTNIVPGEVNILIKNHGASDIYAEEMNINTTQEERQRATNLVRSFGDGSFGDGSIYVSIGDSDNNMSESSEETMFEMDNDHESESEHLHDFSNFDNIFIYGGKSMAVLLNATEKNSTIKITRKS